ncbi:MAG: methyltransferase domain-containing protein [Syntrophomonadaceae bacterium]|nr:methyltransferase domain-containing protein [Syntrophomonadaceae bacterium]
MDATRAKLFRCRKNELTHGNEKNWMAVIMENIPKADFLRVLDIGTGPGFFATCLTKRGYDVTAVDYTEAMLCEARANAGEYNERIAFYRMDAQALDFPEESFDAIVTRNLTWNLERPQDAYNSWCRVLRPGGIMLNFDAAWYSYLFDEEAAKRREQDQERVMQSGVKNFEAYSEGYLMEEMCRELILSRCRRPQIDVEMLKTAGFSSVEVTPNIGERVYDENEKINYENMPMFMLRAVK